MILTSFLKPSTRRAILGSCLAISLFAASVTVRADNPPKFKDPEVTAFVQKVSDVCDALNAAYKAGDEAKMKELDAKFDAVAKGSPGVFTSEGLQPGKATSEEQDAFVKWLTAELGTPGLRDTRNQAMATKSLMQARQIGLALKLWAGDNDGAYPANFDALFPDYLQNKKLLVSPFAPDQPVGYTYHPGLNDAGNPKAILLEDKFAPKAVGKKIVVHVDNSGEVTD